MITDWITLFSEQLRNTSYLEWFAVLFSSLQVVFAQKNSILTYPFGILGTLLSIFLLFEVALYAESFLNLYYFIMSIYGWLNWSKNKTGFSLPVTHAGKQDWLYTGCIVVVGWLILYLILSRFTTSDVPVWDAIVSSFAWAGMWLMAKRKVENWILLNISNFIAVPLLFHKEIFIYALLTIFLFIVACFGYFSWKKQVQLAK